MGVMLQMREPIFGTGNDILLDSNFFVSNSNIYLEQRGVYAGVFVKKHKYWTEDFPGDESDWNFHNRYVGDVDVLDVGKTLAVYKWGRPLLVLPRIRPRLPRGTQRVPRDGEPSQTSTTKGTIRVPCGGAPSQ